MRGRATDTEETIARRLAKADYELGFAPQFDRRVVNEDLDRAADTVARIISEA